MVESEFVEGFLNFFRRKKSKSHQLPTNRSGMSIVFVEGRKPQRLNLTVNSLCEVEITGNVSRSWKLRREKDLNAKKSRAEAYVIRESFDERSFEI